MLKIVNVEIQRKVPKANIVELLNKFAERVSLDKIFFFFPDSQGNILHHFIFADTFIQSALRVKDTHPIHPVSCTVEA